jgi:hypothetical protein
MQDAPVFYPTPEQFADPIGYIRSIQSNAAKYGAWLAGCVWLCASGSADLRCSKSNVEQQLEPQLLPACICARSVNVLQDTGDAACALCLLAFCWLCLTCRRVTFIRLLPGLVLSLLAGVCRIVPPCLPAMSGAKVWQLTCGSSSTCTA